MASTIGLSLKIVPWDDQAFVRAVVAARDQLHPAALTLKGPRACARAEEILRAAGYPLAHVECQRTIEEAMAHVAHWTVRRDGPPA
jgi:hypothetical protein